MSVSLAEIVAASRRGDTSFVAESAGYIVLGLADDALRKLLGAAPVVDGWTARLDAHGDLIPDDVARDVSEVAVERSLRGLLATLLQAVRSPSPNLARVAGRQGVTGLAHLVVELEAALVPVNRKAARRSLARLCRETQRALARGGLSVEPLLHVSAGPRGFPEAHDSKSQEEVAAPTAVSAAREEAPGSPAPRREQELSGFPPRIHSVLAPPLDELDIDITVEESPPLELSKVPPEATALSFEDTPSHILAAAEAAPPSVEVVPPTVAAVPPRADAVPVRQEVPSQEILEPLELSAPAPAVQDEPDRAVFAPEVPPEESLRSSTQLDGGDDGRDETPTQVWAPVAPRIGTPEQTLTPAAPASSEVALAAPTAAEPELAEFAPVASTEFASALPAPAPAAPVLSPGVDEAPPAPASPPFPRLSRRPPSDIAELLARHGGARQTDEAELLEGLGKLAGY
ncbi:MAG: hypothetical protein GX607_11840 [Myxococcales bacterium]|jgi:hypothetical protein|nr:hypothetical protein [Myxococcales bacterium]